MFLMPMPVRVVAAVGGSVFTDDFTGTDGQALEDRTGWTAYNASGVFEISSNRLSAVVSGSNGVVLCNVSAVDGYAKAIWRGINSQSCFLCVRAADGSNNVSVRINAGGNLQVRSEVGGSHTQPISTSASGLGFVAGDEIQLEAEGDTVRVLRNGSSVVSASLGGRNASDSGLGIGGSVLSSGAEIIDNFEAGPL